MKYTSLFVIGLLACSAESSTESKLVGRWSGDDDDDSRISWSLEGNGHFVMSEMARDTLWYEGTWDAHGDSLCFVFRSGPHNTKPVFEEIPHDHSVLECANFQITSVR